VTDPIIPAYPVAWTVDSRVPDKVRALILLVENTSQDTLLEMLAAKEVAKQIRALLADTPPGKPIPMD